MCSVVNSDRNMQTNGANPVVFDKTVASVEWRVDYLSLVRNVMVQTRQKLRYKYISHTFIHNPQFN
jgi:hypothetical protein